jgi:hypothetical protein
MLSWTQNFQFSENELRAGARWWLRGHLGLTPKGQPKTYSRDSHAPLAGVAPPTESAEADAVELNGIEPMTSGLQSPRSPN